MFGTFWVGFSPIGLKFVKNGFDFGGGLLVGELFSIRDGRFPVVVAEDSSKMTDALKKCWSRFCSAARRSSLALMMAIGFVATEAVCRAEGSTPTLPETGVDIGGYITAAITGLGAIVAVAVGGYFAFLLIKLGLRWARRAG